MKEYVIAHRTAVRMREWYLQAKAIKKEMSEKEVGDQLLEPV